MSGEMNMPQWWVQLVDSSPLENHDALRDACRKFGRDREFVRHRYFWDETSSIPTAIAVQGDGPPPDVYGFLKSIQHLIGRNEYMVFVTMVEADTLSQHAISHTIVTRHALATAETGKELLERVKAVVLDADEELAARS